ncbi:PAS domain S-box protein [Methanobacterium sp. SMA-27]|uniref:PAS domain S-box protein n=1 Tax=Methanobacterium sp. SMA-27 TaxID=1495336 RepID=UPI00064E4AC5|nr:PAS domain S-box protein [Methanobacterium sp. SMA-27]
MSRETEEQFSDEIIEMKKEIMKCKKTKIALKKSEERFRTFAESATDGIVTTDDNGNILFFNKILKQIFGYSTDELSGKSLTMLMPAKFRKGYLNELENYKSSGKHRLLGKTVQTTGLRKDGKIFPFEMSLSAWKSNKTTYFSAIIRDITERKQAESEIKKSIVEKENLLREIHYRVKNNMHIISSLLNLQIQHVHEEESEKVLKDTQGRLDTMAMVHKNLYESSSFTKLNFKDYVEKLVFEILSSHRVNSGTIETELDIEDIEMNMETAIPCGLIINELVTNSVKHAFPELKGTIRIELKSFQDELELIVADNGIGLPKNIHLKITETIGLQLVYSLVNQLNGKLKLDMSNGTEFKITFNELEYERDFKSSSSYNGRMVTKNKY